MDRRDFLLAGGALGALAFSGAAYLESQSIPLDIAFPGRAEGHWLRDRKALPPPSARLDTDIAILGSGIAGLTAAWKLGREGQQDFLLVSGPEPYGNAAGGRHSGLAYPTGAHYLPVPGEETFHVREILHDLGVIVRNPWARRPVYDERYLLHAPEERLLFEGRWRERLLPTDVAPDWERAEHARFLREMEVLRAQRGSDGRRPFSLPLALSSADPAWRALDRLTLKDWLTQRGLRSPSLHWYADYCCRDDYGAGHDRISAWAGLHYFCSRAGEAENAADGAWLTWPDGLHPLAAGLDRRAGGRRLAGTAAAVTPDSRGVDILCFRQEGDRVVTTAIRARKVICAMPLHVAARVVAGIGETGFDAARDLPPQAPWLVANFLMKRFPEELPAQPLSWDNVVYGGRGLGYVVSTHQDIRVAPPDSTMFTAYVALSDRPPDAARRWMESASPEALLALAASDLKAAYGRRFARHVERAFITLRGHAMASPVPGFLSNAGREALRRQEGPVLYAHADLSGLSVFEEAAWWGYQAALRAMR